jgi:hypothetical protein
MVAFLRNLWRVELATILCLFAYAIGFTVVLAILAPNSAPEPPSSPPSIGGVWVFLGQFRLCTLGHAPAHPPACRFYVLYDKNHRWDTLVETQQGYDRVIADILRQKP